METLSVRCNHCGAPLQIGEGTRFVTCQFCQSNLEVKRTDSSVFTEEVAKIAENTGRMAESLEIIELQNEIERLDREWAQKEASYIVHGKNGPVRPSTSLFGPAFDIFGACVFFGMAFAIFTESGGGKFNMIGLMPAGMGVFAVVLAVKKMNQGAEFAKAEAIHQARRAELDAKLQQARR
jgi:DNA-directed RNA polymerase subunit RPC12/RpoP